MDPAPSALLAQALLGFVPGVFFYRALRPRGPLLECAALAPTLSFAFIFLFGELATMLDLPFAPVPFLALVGIAGLAAALRRSRSHPVPALPADTAAPDEGPARRLLIAGIILAGLSWIVGLHGLAATPPYTDSVNHGMMAAQVADRESLDPGRVLTSDALGVSEDPGETAFYPLALHGQTALAERIFGVTFADGLLASTLLFSVFVLPLGLYFAARRLDPERPLVAGIAALLGSTIGFVPILPMSFGGLPLIIGLAMVPAVAVVAMQHLVQGGSKTAGPLAAVGVIGILATHTSEIPLLAIMLGCATAEALWRRSVPFRAVLGRSAVLGAMIMALVAPTLPVLAGGTSERTGVDEGAVTSIFDAAAELPGILDFNRGIDFVALGALAGVVICIKRRRHLALVGTATVIVGLYFVAAALGEPFDLITVPWYQHPGRVALNLVLITPVLAAIALVELGPAFAQRLHRHRGDVAPIVTLVVVVAVLGLLPTTGGLRDLFKARSTVGEDARSAFSYLRSQVKEGERVLNDGNTDGAMWMYPFEGIAPLMGLQPARPGASWDERLWLVRNLPEVGKDPKVTSLLTKYNVRFVYYDERNFDLNPHHMDGEELLDSPGLCQRFNQGTVRVFEVTPENVCV